jgi:MoaA/NifB/PqqE/SkfB family radical SAM enzyme
MTKFGPRSKRFIKTFLSNKIARKGYPYFGSLEVTRQCNSRCSFCPIGNEKQQIKEGEVGTKEMKKVLKQFGDLNIIAVSFLGGEPMLRKDVCDLAEYGHNQDMIIQVSTNGLNLHKMMDRATAAFDVIVISLDVVDPELYRDIRGVDKYETVVDNIKSAQELGAENECNILINTVVCSKNLDQIPKVIKFSKELGVRGIMVDFATFHDYWTETVNDTSRYNPAEMDWRNDRIGTKKLIKKIIEMKKDYSILTSKAYLETFLTENFDFRCYPNLFCCVRKEGEVAIPCWDSNITKFYDIINKYSLQDLWFSNEVKALRNKVADCKDCYMHCIVEPSKVLGATTRNLKDLMEWVVTFRNSAFNV